MLRLKKDITCDGHLLRFAPKCDDPWFYRKKECDHQWNKVAVDQIADIFTKPVHDDIFLKLWKLLLNW
jgi:hypothetical protein